MQDTSNSNHMDPFSDAGHEKEETDATLTTTRDPSCGVLAFHDGTEQALLLFVQNEIYSDKFQQPPALTPQDGEEEKIRQATTILQLVDTFCTSRHWMMHIGPIKGPIMERFLIQCCQEKQSTLCSQELILVEVGTYCGYSLIRMAKTLLQQKQPFHIFTVDVNVRNVNVAKQLVALAGLSQYVTFLVLNGRDDTELSRQLESAITNYQTSNTQTERSEDERVSIDFLFLDHDKEAYLADLRQLENSALVRAGTFVCADNIVFFQLQPYREHMMHLAAQQIVQTQLEKSQLEYVVEDDDTTAPPGGPEKTKDNFEDGLELTIYLKDPLIAH